MKRAALMVCLILCCLLLTACYTERDPWPGINDGTNSIPAVSTAPTATPEPEPEPQPEPEPENAVEALPNLNG